MLYTVVDFVNVQQDPPDWSEILTYFRGSELQNYFTKILEDDLKAVIKPQYVDQIPKAVKVRVLMRVILCLLAGDVFKAVKVQFHQSFVKFSSSVLS